MREPFFEKKRFPLSCCGTRKNLRGLYRLIFFDRGHSSRSLFPAPRAVALVPS